MRNAVLAIVNPAAGGEEKEILAAAIRRAFADQGIPVALVVARTPADLLEWTSRAIADGAGAVVAAGGDGTVSAVASVLAGTSVPLGVLPVGTLNHFARDLRLPPSLPAAVAVIGAGRVAAVDVCEVNGRVFINNSSLGLYPALVQERECREKEGHRRWSAFAWALAMALRRYATPVVRLQAAGHEMLRRAPVVFVGNNVYEVEGLRIGMRHNLASGQMCVYVLHKTGRLALLGLAAAALAGRLTGTRDFDALCARELRIDSRRSQLQVALDGEVVTMTPPLLYRVRPGALRVLVPGD